MIARLQHICDEAEINQADWRNVNILTAFSKLVLALVMGLLVIIVLLIS